MDSKDDLPPGWLEWLYNDTSETAIRNHSDTEVRGRDYGRHYCPVCGNVVQSSDSVLPRHWRWDYGPDPTLAPENTHERGCGCDTCSGHAGYVDCPAYGRQAVPLEQAA